jgi:hypothetical protein
MKSNAMHGMILALVLSISLIATGCSALWISVALVDLPVLTQMALNLAALMATLQSGKQLTPPRGLGDPEHLGGGQQRPIQRLQGKSQRGRLADD